MGPPNCPVCADPPRITAITRTYWGHFCTVTKRFLWWNRTCFSSDRRQVAS